MWCLLAINRTRLYNNIIIIVLYSEPDDNKNIKDARCLINFRKIIIVYTYILVKLVSDPDCDYISNNNNNNNKAITVVYMLPMYKIYI